VLEDIITLRKEGLSFRKIAKRLGTTVGKVQYQWVKYQKEQGKQTVERNLNVPPQESEIIAVTESKPKRRGKYRVPSLIKPEINELVIALSAPNRLFCQWNLEERFSEAMQNAYELPLNKEVADLRLYDVTDIIFNGKNAHSVHIFKVPMADGFWHISGLKPNRTYLCEIGFITVKNDFFPLLRSQPVHTSYVEGGGHTEMQRAAEAIPSWTEHVSTYSYYERQLEEGYE